MQKNWGMGASNTNTNWPRCVPLLAAFVLCGGLHHGAQAQERIYRCGNEYTNNPGQNPQARGCKLVEGGNITVVEGLKPRAGNGAGGGVGKAPAGGSVSSARNGNERVDNAEQRARDSDARTILESELRKAETRVNELRTEFANGEPEKRGDEFRNHQRYQDRVSELKAALVRAESDVAGLRRELARLAAPALSAPAAGNGTALR
jgi:hypothetical protein